MLKEKTAIAWKITFETEELITLRPDFKTDSKNKQVYCKPELTLQGFLFARSLRSLVLNDITIGYCVTPFVIANNGWCWKSLRLDCYLNYFYEYYFQAYDKIFCVGS